MAIAGLLFGVAYSAVMIHIPIGLPMLTASIFGLGVLFGKTLHFKSKVKEVTV